THNRSRIIGLGGDSIVATRPDVPPTMKMRCEGGGSDDHIHSRKPAWVFRNEGSARRQRLVSDTLACRLPRANVEGPMRDRGFPHAGKSVLSTESILVAIRHAEAGHLLNNLGSNFGRTLIAACARPAVRVYTRRPWLPPSMEPGTKSPMPGGSRTNAPAHVV